MVLSVWIRPVFVCGLKKRYVAGIGGCVKTPDPEAQGPARDRAAGADQLSRTSPSVIFMLSNRK